MLHSTLAVISLLIGVSYGMPQNCQDKTCVSGKWTDGCGVWQCFYDVNGDSTFETVVSSPADCEPLNNGITTCVGGTSTTTAMTTTTTTTTTMSDNSNGNGGYPYEPYEPDMPGSYDSYDSSSSDENGYMHHRKQGASHVYNYIMSHKPLQITFFVAIAIILLLTTCLTCCMCRAAYCKG